MVGRGVDYSLGLLLAWVAVAFMCPLVTDWWQLW